MDSAGLDNRLKQHHKIYAQTEPFPTKDFNKAINQQLQNIIDWFMPYYKTCPICPNGTPHAGYFGSSDPDITKNSISYALIMNLQAILLLTPVPPNAMTSTVDMNCVYGRKCHLQHCCLGTNPDWCKNALRPVPIGGSGGSVSFDSSTQKWTWTGSCSCNTGIYDRITKLPIYTTRNTVYTINITPRNPFPVANQLSTETCCKATFNIVQNGCGRCSAKPGTTTPTPPTGFSLTTKSPVSMGLIGNINEPDHL